MLNACEQALWERYDLALLDLDGVVYIGGAAVPGAPEHLRAAADSGMKLAFVTNNASRPPREVASHLTELGVPATSDDVVTSAQAAARLLADQLDPGSAVFVLGGPGLVEALTETGLRPVDSIDEQPVAVASGYHRELRWGTVSAGAILVRNGLLWVASNTDYTVPTPDGVGPGNGVLVEAVARFAGREPLVAGKPRPPLFEETQRRVGGHRPLVVGDRLDTDIEGAVNSGLDSLLVLTGVTGLAELVTAAPHRRPTYLATDLGGLASAHAAPERDGPSFTLAGWRAVVEEGALRLDGAGAADDGWRALAAAAWAHLDETGACVETDGLTPPG